MKTTCLTSWSGEWFAIQRVHETRRSLNGISPIQSFMPLRTKETSAINRQNRYCQIMMNWLTVSGHFIIFGLLIMTSNWSQFSNRATSARSHKFVQTGFMSVISLLIYERVVILFVTRTATTTLVGVLTNHFPFFYKGFTRTVKIQII